MTDYIKEALTAAAGEDFDNLGGEEMQIPLFIFPDGEVRPLSGKFRGFGAISGSEAGSEFILGIYTETGEYHNILVDGRVQCHIPMFFIAGKPYHFPIVQCHTMCGGMPVIDPATGNMRSQEDLNKIMEMNGASDRASLRATG